MPKLNKMLPLLHDNKNNKNTDLVKSWK